MTASSPPSEVPGIHGRETDRRAPNRDSVSPAPVRDGITVVTAAGLPGICQSRIEGGTSGRQAQEPRTRFHVSHRVEGGTLGRQSISRLGRNFRKQSHEAGGAKDADCPAHFRHRLGGGTSAEPSITDRGRYFFSLIPRCVGFGVTDS